MLALPLCHGKNALGTIVHDLVIPGKNARRRDGARKIPRLKLWRKLRFFTALWRRSILLARGDHLGLSIALAAHDTSGHAAFRLVILNGVCNVLSNNKPIGSNGFSVRFSGSLTAVVVVKSTPEVEYTCSARPK